MKRSLRESILCKRNKLSEGDIISKSGRIHQNLASLNEFKDAGTILFYVSFKSEVHTHGMIKEFLGSKKVIVPKVDFKNKRLVLSEIRDFDELKEGPFGILEPATVREVYPMDIDLVIVPGVAFDREGYRIGYGFGFYDRLLSEISVPKVALAFEMQVVDKITFEEHDVKVDKIVTENEIISV